MSFDSDCSEQKIIERKVCDFLRLKTKRNLLVSQGEDKDGDIYEVITGKRVYYAEVKNDKMNVTTGNVAFEITYRGMPSGIFTSKSKWLFYIVRSHLYCRSIEDTVKWLRSSNFRIVSGGDGNRSSMYLVPIDCFLDFFSIVI